MDAVNNEGDLKALMELHYGVLVGCHLRLEVCGVNVFSDPHEGKEANLFTEAEERNYLKQLEAELVNLQGEFERAIKMLEDGKAHFDRLEAREKAEATTNKMQVELDLVRAAMVSHGEAVGARIMKLEEKLGVKTTKF
ncbi:hypothetical protein C1H46_042413 [Malus baccata]|uniref:Uncharacterized protein n=1 Tax=Malus baccata TaxID=106549 RepID=A0A540KCV0_MALBA|nr:hypothetical protein C1H46_042413 [Malus baccata]